ncbi:Nucleolar protein 16, partial [Armadillidium nasatum]
MGSTKQRKRKIGKYRYKAKRDYKKFKESTTSDNMMKAIKQETKQELWDKKKSAQENCSKLGILYHLRKAMVPKTFKDEALELEENDYKKSKERKVETDFVKSLTTKCKQKQKTKPYNLRLPERTVEYLTYLLDTYGEDYKAMSQDGRNYDQETWKQLRAKINKFKSCTDQYAQYLKKRGLLT